MDVKKNLGIIILLILFLGYLLRTQNTRDTSPEPTTSTTQDINKNKENNEGGLVETKRIENDLSLSLVEARKMCSKKTLEALKKSELPTPDLLALANLGYSMCLVNEGFESEDLVSVDSRSSIKETQDLDNMGEGIKCQEEINKYNTCLSEYSIKLGEYNTCTSKASDPNSYNYGMFCNKPFNFCMKPVCAY